MTMTSTSGLARLAAAACACIVLASCAGDDYTPLYFPPPGGEDGKAPSPSEGASGRQCTLSFTSQLCIQIKGANIEVGTTPDDALCAEVPPFPIHIAGTTVSLKGSEFPDVLAEGHGLPAPITINARGAGDGSSNVGEGTIDASGNMSIEHLSLFIVALGVVGEVPNLTLTTGTTEDLPALPAVTGAPPDAGGAMTLVTGTVLGHTIDAADKYLMGASLTAVFTGQVSPPLSQCGGEGEPSIEVKRLFISRDGQQTEAPIADGNRLEVSTGTYIADGPSDVGERFEATAKFRVRNIGTKPQSIQIAPQIGPFFLHSIDPLTRTLPPQQSFILDITFRPTAADQPGTIALPLPIGIDQFTLVGVALSKDGRGSVSAVDDDGNVTAPDVGEVRVGEAAVPANAERAFFRCQRITCGEAAAFTACTDCPDPETTPCELLAVSTSGRPLGEVDAQCAPIDPAAVPLYTIDLKGGGTATLSGHKQVLAIRNKGVEPLEIRSIAIEDTPESKSKGEFTIPPNAIFVAKRFSEIQSQVAAALAGQRAQGATIPLTLSPFHRGYDETTVYVVVTYQPSDLVGADGQQAGVGSAVRDRAIVRIRTDAGAITTVVTGETTIREAPALELYFKTSVGVKRVADGWSFPFRGVTPQTVDLAFPLFLRVGDTAAATLRIASIAIDGADAANFRWLDTAEEIANVKPPAGRGMRCSIPQVDPATGEMTGESFDLKPVSLEPPGFDMAPGAYSVDTMPLFGCVDFHRDEGGPAPKRLYEARLAVTAQELSPQGTPVKNPDGSARQTQLAARLLAALNPKSGKMVLRITQTMAAILNPQFPGLSSISSRADVAGELASGEMKETDLQLFTGAMILDPFDEMTITTSDGKEVVSTPSDGITAVFRTLDTHPVTEDYASGWLFDYANLLHDGGRPEGQRGIYEDYPNVPEGARANGWRIFTSTLSYPGPIAPAEKKPGYPSDCAIVNPCDPEDLKKFTDAGAAGGKGACAFFYASGGRLDSPAFHTAAEMEGGEYDRLCNRVGEAQGLIDMNTGHSSVDGRVEVEEIGLRFFGPTYFHNPGGPLGAKPPLDGILPVGFTTGILKPPAGPDDINILPDPKIDLSKGEFKINLNDAAAAIPPICENNTGNRVVNGRRYSTWRYLEGLLFKDEEGTIPAGCPEEGNAYSGGQAYLRGRDVDPDTGTVTFVAGAKFGTSDDLSFAFKDVMMFIVLNGWLCDPEGDEANFEGAKCFDPAFNDHDALGQISIVKQ